MSVGRYTQDFDSLGAAGPEAWTNNVTLSGWYAARSAGGGEVTSVVSGDGSSTAGNLYSFGQAGSSERALGSLASGTSGTLSFGARFINDTGEARSNFVVSYTGEQWRAGSGTTQRLAFSYRTGILITNADVHGADGWTLLPELDFVSPSVAASRALNGNASSNRIFLARPLTGLVVPAGEELFIRWLDVDDGGFDNGLGIDELSISFGQPVTNSPPALGSTGMISVVTYNLAGNFTSDWSTNAAQVQAIARELRFLSPDIIAVNEIPNGLRSEMTNWMTAFFPGYNLAISAGTDGAIRNGVITRYPITRTKSWLDGTGLTNFGYAGTFTRDLFEAELALPDFPQRLHVFVAHLKSGTSSPDDAARRAAEAMAISNFFVAGFLTTNALHPYLFAGDMNEDVMIPATGSQQPIQRLTNGTGLNLTTPINPVTQARYTHSIRSSNGPARRYDYIFPCGILLSNIQSAEVFRTDVLSPLPADVEANDSATASDHLPVKVVFRNPYIQPFQLSSLIHGSDNSVTLQWESVPGQSYCVESASSFGAAWTTLVTGIVATNYSQRFQTNSTSSGRFFRVRRNG